MATEIIPLGTASAVPTRDRHLSSTALVREGSLLLFDCGEGTQFRMLQAGIKRSRIDAILISHLHGDHFYGLLGILSTLGMLRREEPVTLVGPVGLEAFVRSAPGLEEPGNAPFPLRFVTLPETFDEMTVLDTPDYRVTARLLEHRIPTAGFRYEEKARSGNLDPARAAAAGVEAFEHFRQLKAGLPVTLADGREVQPADVVGPERPGAVFAYVTDTRPCVGGQHLALGADLLLHEATFSDALRERAIETGHSTSVEAATIAREAGARRLLLGHFSARYAEPGALVEEARRVFKNTEAAQELKRYPLLPVA